MTKQSQMIQNRINIKQGILLLALILGCMISTIILLNPDLLLAEVVINPVSTLQTWIIDCVTVKVLCLQVSTNPLIETYKSFGNFNSEESLTLKGQSATSRAIVSIASLGHGVELTAQAEGSTNWPCCTVGLGAFGSGTGYVSMTMKITKPKQVIVETQKISYLLSVLIRLWKAL